MTTSDRRSPGPCARALAILLALLATQHLAAADPVAEPLLERIADQARLPAWSPSGTGLAWISEVARPGAERDGAMAPGMRQAAPVVSSGIAMRDLATGQTRMVDLVHDAPPLLGLAWMPDASAVLAWDELRVWRIPSAAGPLVASELLRVEGGQRIESLLIAPGGADLLVVCDSPAAAGMRAGREILACSADGKRRSATIGRQPLWLPDGTGFLVSRADQLCRITLATGAAVDLFSAGYYLTHPFPKPVIPPEGTTHELWPAAFLDDGWLAVDVLEVELRSRGPNMRHAFHGERVLWKPAAATVNDRLTDAFVAFSEIGRRGERADIAMLPLDDQGRFLRLESMSDPAVRLGRIDFSSRLQRTLAMTVDARAGAILAIHDLPPSCRVEREIRSEDGSSRQELDADPVRYHCDGLSADRTQALFRFEGWAGGDRRSGQGLLWLDPATGKRRWLELPTADFSRRASLSAVPSPDGSRAAVAVAGTGARSLWLARPDPAQVRPPMELPYHAAVQATSRPQRRVSVVLPTGEMPAPAPAPPAKSDF